jgi:hypothetical protein
MRQQPLAQYYFRQACVGSSDCIGAIYSTPPILQRGRGSLGNILLSAYRFLRPHTWTAAKTLVTESLKALGREAFLTGIVFAYDLAENPHTYIKDLVSKTQTNIRKI